MTTILKKQTYSESDIDMTQSSHQSDQPHSPFVKHSIWLSIFICGLAALFYLYEFILQVSPGVMTNELMHDLTLNAAGLGFMSSCYYYAYASMQMPAGFLYDSLGPRRVVTAAIFVCSIGAIIFGMANTMAIASFGRLMMGAGSAFAFIGALVLISRWFDTKYFAILAGITQTLSSVGAVIGGGPLASSVEHYGWRHTILFVGAVGFILCIAFAIFVRNYPKGSQIQTREKLAEGEFISNLKRICTNSQSWLTAIYAFCSWAPITVFAALWGVPYMMSAYHLSATKASFAVSLIWVGIGVASPILGWLSDRMGSRNKPLSYVSILGVVSTVIIIFVPHVPFSLMLCMLFLFGCAAGGQALSFAVVKDNNHTSVVGTAVGLNNMAVVVGGAIFQPLVGVLLQAHWTGKIVKGIHYYSVTNYQTALSIIPVCYLVGFIFSRFFIKETHCIAQHTKVK